MSKPHVLPEHPLRPAQPVPDAGNELLKFDHVSFAYDERLILKDVAFSIRQGEIVSLLGPSGCGKTTILNIIPGRIAASCFSPTRCSTG